MKVYTEVNYEFKNGVLVEQSSKSYNYKGEVSLCKGGGGGGNPIKTAVETVSGGVEKAQSNVSEVITDNPVTANVPDASLITENIRGAMQDNPSLSFGGATVPNIPTAPNINIPDASHATSMLTAGINKAAENIGYVVQGVADPIIRNINEAGKLVKEATTGEGGYSDDLADTPGPGETGFEDATGTLLTRGRKREAPMGRAFHSGGGTASTV